MPISSSHLTVLESSATQYAAANLFRVPILDTTGQVAHWRSISYAQFHHDVDLYARHWTRVFKNDGLPPQSIIGLWISGLTYPDILHIYGISKAGYIPQLFSLKLPNPNVVYELLRKAGASALVYDACYEEDLVQKEFPLHRALVTERIESVSESLPSIYDRSQNDTAFIFHTSGSTSGSPKLVPLSYRWMASAVAKSRYIGLPIHAGRQDVLTVIGSMCHIGQTFMFLGQLQHGACIIQPTSLAFSADELVDMIRRCGLNRLNQFAAFLSMHLRRCRDDPKLFGMLMSLDEIAYSGMPLPHDEEQRARQDGLKLRNIFGSTEMGAMLISGEDQRNPSLLAPIPGCGSKYEFRLIDSADREGVYQSTASLFELVILSSSPDCPNSSLCAPDGDFYTGDLFQEVEKGFFVSRGRNDDWIKTQTSLRCDTKSIEDNARAMCPTLISECIVVGTGRPSPVMFVEPTDPNADHNKVKKEIIRRTRHWHSRRYIHERITSTNMIVIVPPKTLPRTATKGNIRRQAVEEAFREEIDRIFGIVQA